MARLKRSIASPPRAATGIRWSIVAAWWTRNRGGAIKRVMGITADVTKSRQAEQENHGRGQDPPGPEAHQQGRPQAALERDHRQRRRHEQTARQEPKVPEVTDEMLRLQSLGQPGERQDRADQRRTEKHDRRSDSRHPGLRGDGPANSPLTLSIACVSSTSHLRRNAEPRRPRQIPLLRRSTKGALDERFHPSCSSAA